MWAQARPRLPGRWATPIGAVVLALLAVGAVVEFRSDMPAAPVPRDPATVAVYDWLRDQPPGAVFELPANGLLVDEPRTVRQMYYSTRHWHPLVAGYTSYYPAGYLDFLLTFHGGPEALRHRSGVSEVSAANVGLLQDIGVRYVVLHQGGQYDWRRALAEADQLPQLTWLGEIGDATVYALDPGDRVPLRFALVAPRRACAGGETVAALAIGNDNATSAVRLGGVPPAARFTWRDARGKVAARGQVPLALPVVEPGGTALPVALATPVAPGEYRLQLSYGTLAAPLDAIVAVGTAEEARPGAPPLALTNATDLGGDRRAGELVQVLLEWRVGDRLTRSYTATVQLLGPDGRVVSQSDGLPFRGLYQTTDWRPGVTVLQPLAVRIPADAPPGAYRLLVAFYDAADAGQPRLPIALPDGTAGSAEYLEPLTVSAP